VSIVADTSQFAGPLPAGLAQPGVRQWAQRVAEKVRVAVAGGLRFFPQLDRYTEETSEIRQAYRLMLRDPVLRSAHDYKVQGVSSLDWNVIPTSSTPAGPTDRDEEVAEFWRHCFRRVEGGTPAIVDAVVAGALVDGFSVSNWSAEPEADGDFAGKLVLDRVKPKDTRYLQLLTDEFRNVTGVRAGTYNGGHVFDPAADNLLVYSHSSLFASPSGTSDHRAAYGAWWLKDVVTKLLALHLDKWVSPALKGTYSTRDQKEALEEALENLRADGWLTIPMGAAVEALQIATRGESEFIEALERCDKQMLIGVLGAYLQIIEGQVPDGRGDTKVSKSVTDLKLWALVAAVQNVVNRQLVAPLTRLNYSGVRPPLVTLGAVSEQEMLTYLQIDDGLANKLGFVQDGKDIAARYNRKRATSPADALTPPAPAPAGGPPA
jgi:phage gp29-like protein